jgi:DNA-binding NarL/FixJ family response regulator
MYGTRLAGGQDGRTAVIIQPAPHLEILPILELAYGLTARERQVSQLCLRGLATKEIAETLRVSQYTVQDHLKAIFDKTGARSRGELVGRIFLEHYVPRWEALSRTSRGWDGFDMSGPERGGDTRPRG